MADRVHPNPSPVPVEPPPSGTKNPSPPPSEAYVVQIPKDQIYRYPPPENARRLRSLAGKKPRRGRCFRCLCWTFGLLFLLAVLLGVAAGALYLVLRPETPKYTIDGVVITGLNLTSPAPISPEFDFTVRADNPNGRIGIRYLGGSSVSAYYSDVNLCSGTLPAFYQPSNNVTVFVATLKGSGVSLGRSMTSRLVGEQRRGKVPFRLNMEVPVSIRVGSAETWSIKVKVSCVVTVDGLTAKSRIRSKQCDYGVKLW